MKPAVHWLLRFVFPAALLAAITACGGGSGYGGGSSGNGGGAVGTTYTVGGVVTGLTTSGLVLQNNGIGNLTVSAAGSFTFAADFANGTAYAVTVKTQPAATQNCVVSNGSGTINGADVTDVTVVCSLAFGRFAYAANAGDNTISVYSINASTGALAANGTPVATGISPYAIAGSPDGMHVYVGNETSNNISAYAVNATSGALTPISGSPIAAGIDPQALAFDPSGAYLYVANNGSDNLSAYAVDASSGALTPLSTATYATGTGPSAISVDPNGKFVYVANNGGSNNISVFAITAGTGELTPVAGSPFAAGDNPHSLAIVPFSNFSSKTFLYTANFSGASSTVSGFSVDLSTGALTALNGSPFALAVSNYIAILTTYGDPLLYVTTGASVVGYNIDQQTGLLSASSGFPVAAGSNAYSVTINPNASALFVYVCNDGDASISVYAYDPFTGELQAVPGSPFAAGNHPDFIAVL